MSIIASRLVSLRRWYVTIACVHANKFHSFNFYLLFESDECFCVYGARGGDAHRQSSYGEIVLKLWCGTQPDSQGSRMDNCLLPGVVYTEHDTIYIYWMLDGEFVRDDTHTYDRERERDRERILACNINQIIYRKLWYSVSSSIRLRTPCTHARPFCT